MIEQLPDIHREPDLAFADFYDAALKTPELAVYVIRVGTDGGSFFEDANDFLAKVAGKPLSEIRGRSVDDVFGPEVAACLIAHLRSAIATGEPLAYERTSDLPNGRTSFKTSLIPITRGSGRINFIVGLTRDVTPEADLVELSTTQAALLRNLGIALPSAVYVLDMDDHSLKFVGGEAGEAQLEWRKGAEQVGPAVGEKYFHPEDWPKALAHWAHLAALADGEVSTISYRLLAAEGEYRRHVHREIVLKRNLDGRVKLVLGLSEDVSEHDKVEQELRDLSEHIHTLQIDERRRIAQELHDSTGQHLTAAALALGKARTVQSGAREGKPEVLEAIDDAAHCVREAQNEIRVLSYLLHPPHLQSGGLAQALEQFASDFARRAGLEVETSIDPAARSISDDVAVQLFRVCQEALTNVYRHAQAHRVNVILKVGEPIELTVKDDGIGINASGDDFLGLGLPGMKERMAGLGGAITISGGPSGTTLIATIPNRRGGNPGRARVPD